MSLLTSKQLLKYLPQSHPFVMVSELLEYSETKAKASLKINSDNLLIEGDFFSEAGLLEFMAQTLALHSAYGQRFDVKNKVKVGMIGAVKNFEILALPKVNETIFSEMLIKSTFMNMTLAKVTVYSNKDHILATAELKTATSE